MRISLLNTVKLLKVSFSNNAANSFYPPCREKFQLDESLAHSQAIQTKGPCQRSAQRDTHTERLLIGIAQRKCRVVGPVNVIELLNGLWELSGAPLNKPTEAADGVSLPLCPTHGSEQQSTLNMMEFQHSGSKHG